MRARCFANSVLQTANNIKTEGNMYDCTWHKAFVTKLQEDFKKSIWVDEENQIFQWLLECASKLNFPFHAYQLMKFAENYFETDKDKHDLEVILRM